MHYSIPISQRQRKLIKSLHQKQYRDQNSLFVAEGIKLCQELINSDYEAVQIIARDSPSADVINLVDKFNDKGIPVYTAAKHIFTQMCKQKTPEGIIAVVNIKEKKIQKNEPYIALDGVSDPGNVGTIIRSAEWFGIKQVILGENCADHFAPRTVRASMGSVFRVRVSYQSDLYTFLEENFNKIDCYAANIHTKNKLEDLKPKGKFGLLFGSESHGINEKFKNIIKDEFIIAGNGSAESLNVSVSAGIAMNHFAKFL